MPCVPLGPFSLSVAPYPPKLIWLVKINLILPFLRGPTTSIWEMLSYLLGLGDSCLEEPESYRLPLRVNPHFTLLG